MKERDELADERRVVELLEQGVPHHAAPAELRERVERLLAPARPRSLRKLAAVAAVLIATLTLVETRRDPAATPKTSELVLLAAGTHVRYARGEMRLDVDSDRARTICGFFAGRVPFEVELPDASKPYQLAGARLVSFRNEPAAFVAYRQEGRPVSLLIASARTVQPAGGEVVASGKLRFHVEAIDGLQVITWTDNGLTYALAAAASAPRGESCVVCHASPAERPKLQPLLRTRS